MRLPGIPHGSTFTGGFIAYRDYRDTLKVEWPVLPNVTGGRQTSHPKYNYTEVFLVIGGYLVYRVQSVLSIVKSRSMSKSIKSGMEIHIAYCQQLLKLSISVSPGPADKIQKPEDVKQLAYFARDPSRRLAPIPSHGCYY